MGGHLWKSDRPLCALAIPVVSRQTGRRDCCYVELTTDIGCRWNCDLSKGGGDHFVTVQPANGGEVCGGWFDKPLKVLTL